MKQIVLILVLLIAMVGQTIAQNNNRVNATKKANKRQNTHIVDSLKKVIRQQNKIIIENYEYISAQEQQLYTKYVKIARKSELLSTGLITKGNQMRGNNVNYSRLSPELFQPFDIRNTEIKIPSSRFKILTPTSKEFYKVEIKDSLSSVLHILDPERFWYASNYLIIQTY